jgi:catechol 2,3-dioxygenase-like lactoylglutathione lyase family enzyme
MIQVKRMSHVTLETPDLQRQIDYFTQVVGLQEAGRENGTAFLATGRRRSSSSGVGALTIAHIARP